LFAFVQARVEHSASFVFLKAVTSTPWHFILFTETFFSQGLQTAANSL
jgi:hypothetical protein